MLLYFNTDTYMDRQRTDHKGEITKGPRQEKPGSKKILINVDKINTWKVNRSKTQSCIIIEISSQIYNNFPVLYTTYKHI